MIRECGLTLDAYLMDADTRAVFTAIPPTDRFTRLSLMGMTTQIYTRGFEVVGKDHRPTVRRLTEEFSAQDILDHYHRFVADMPPELFETAVQNMYDTLTEYHMLRLVDEPEESKDELRYTIQVSTLFAEAREKHHERVAIRAQESLAQKQSRLMDQNPMWGPPTSLQEAFDSVPDRTLKLKAQRDELRRYRKSGNATYGKVIPFKKR